MFPGQVVTLLQWESSPEDHPNFFTAPDRRMVLCYALGAKVKMDEAEEDDRG